MSLRKSTRERRATERKVESDLQAQQYHEEHEELTRRKKKSRQASTILLQGKLRVLLAHLYNVY
jgi:hypothetical protein